MAAKDVVFLLFLHSPPATAAPLEQWRTLFSLSQSLMRRVSTARAARGDLAGAARTGPSPTGSTAGGASGRASSPRAGTASGTPHGGTSPLEVFGVMTDINQRLAAVNELGRVGSDAGRARGVAGDYRLMFSAVASLLQILLLALSRSGPLKDAVLALRQEVEEGGLVRDFLAVGSADLKGLVVVAKDLAFQYLFDGSREDDEL